MNEDKLKTSKSNKIYYYITIGIFVVYMIAVIVIKQNVENFQPGSFYISLGAGTLLFLGIIAYLYWSSHKHKIEVESAVQESKRVPKPITIVECRELVKNNVTFNPMFATYIRPVSETIENLGTGVKNSIYTQIAKEMDFPYRTFCIIINCNFPNLHNVLIDPSDYEIEKIKKRSPINPEEEPDILRTTERNPLLGTERMTEEIKHHKKEEREKLKEEEGEIK